MQSREDGVDVDQYLMICEQLGQEPKQEDMPVEFSDFHPEVQQAIMIYNLLPSRIAEFSGTYLGKDFGNLSFFFDMYEIERGWRQFYFQVVLMLDSIQSEIIDKKRKAKEASRKKPK